MKSLWDTEQYTKADGDYVMRDIYAEDEVADAIQSHYRERGFRVGMRDATARENVHIDLGGSVSLDDQPEEVVLSTGLMVSFWAHQAEAIAAQIGRSLEKHKDRPWTKVGSKYYVFCCRHSTARELLEALTKNLDAVEAHAADTRARFGKLISGMADEGRAVPMPNGTCALEC